MRTTTFPRGARNLAQASLNELAALTQSRRKRDPFRVSENRWVLVEGSFSRGPECETSPSLHPRGFRVRGLLGRALGHFILSLIGLKRILFTNIFQKL